MTARNIKALRLTLPFFALLFAVALLPSSALAIDLGDEEVPYCHRWFCDGSPGQCNQFCKHPVTNQFTSCKHYFSDYDLDGVPNTSDNCDCNKNANQANCDGDSLGDACDSSDNSWTLQSTSSSTCWLSVWDQGSQDYVSLGGKQIYTSSCGGGTCVRPYQTQAFHCSPSATYSCCITKTSASNCALLPGTDFCGGPRCTF